jgi:hypothetical protein
VPDQWDASFVNRSPAFAPFSEVARPLRECRDWPGLSLLQDLCDARALVNARGMPLRLTHERTGDPYETRLYERGELHVRRGLWHDLFNVLAWLAYPKTKAALNARHHEAAVRSSRSQSTRGSRPRVRDALTLFDESGAIVVASDPVLLERIRAFDWKRLFWTDRASVEAHLRVCVIGHALAEKLLAPYVGVTAHALLLPPTVCLPSPPPAWLTEVDDRAAPLVRSGPAFDTPGNLCPLPLLGIPGWSPASAVEAFYGDTAYFRPGRRVPPR